MWPKGLGSTKGVLRSRPCKHAIAQQSSGSFKRTSRHSLLDRVLGCGFLELGEGLREIVFEILGVGRIVEAVDVPIFVQSSDLEGPAGNNCRVRLLNGASAGAQA